MILVLSLLLLLILSFSSIAFADIIPDYGFPRCYSSFEDYDTNFVNSSPNNEERPLVGQERFPYEGTTKEECDALPLPVLGLGPHWSAIGLTLYEYDGDISTCEDCLPEEFQNTLIVASHGSWNRSPYIGYNVKSYNINFDTYDVTDQRNLLPSLRHATTGKRIRPVDVRMSPLGDGSLLMTADRDDISTSTRGGGLYRIRRRRSGDNSNTNNNATMIDLADVNTSGENPGNVVIELIADIPCARQITVSTDNPRLVYVSSFGGFCPARGGGNRIWVVELNDDTQNNSDNMVRSFNVLVEGLLEPQGIDWSKGTLYIATTGTGTTNKGNCVLQMDDVDDYVLSSSLPMDGNTDDIVKTVVCGFTSTQSSHAWRSLRVHPSGDYAILSVGADCNWPCQDGDKGNQDYQTTLLRVNLRSSSVTIAAKGIRNAIGLWFDPNENLLFTSFGSDRANGIPNAPSADNVPDCTLELLRLPDDPITTPIPISPAPTSASSPISGPNLCFSGDNKVEVMGRKGLVRMDSIKIGDSVRVRDGTFSKVYSFGHYNRDIAAKYLQIYYHRNNDDNTKSSSLPLEISEDHMVFIATTTKPTKQHDTTSSISTATTTPAAMLKVGDKLVITAAADDDATTTTATIYKINKNVSRKGAYAPFTYSGDIVVSGVAASNYVSMGIQKVPFGLIHWIAHTFKSPHRLVCSHLNFAICENETYTDGLSNWIYDSYYFASWMIRHSQMIIFSIIIITLSLLLLLLLLPGHHGIQFSILKQI